jgi:hypothetical protein
MKIIKIMKMFFQMDLFALNVSSLMKLKNAPVVNVTSKKMGAVIILHVDVNMNSVGIVFKIGKI